MVAIYGQLPARARVICRNVTVTALATKELIGVLGSWVDRVGEHSYPPSVLARLRDILRMTAMPSAPSTVRMAAQLGSTAVRKDELAAWQKLRNPTAHGQGLGAPNLSLILDYDRVLTLFYRLCLKAIGYSGPAVVQHRRGEEGEIEEI